MRSPATPCSATSRRSLVPTSRPSGIFPGGNVFQLPPPAFEARATPEASAGTGCAGNTGTGVAVAGGGGWATATLGAGATVGAAVATGADGGVRADATANGVEVGAAGF